MTLELLHVIRDYNIHLQGHQYQSMQVIYVGWQTFLWRMLFYLAMQVSCECFLSAVVYVCKANISPRIVLVPKVPDPFFGSIGHIFRENSREPKNTVEHWPTSSREDLARSPQSSEGRVPKRWSATVFKNMWGWGRGHTRTCMSVGSIQRN